MTEVFVVDLVPSAVSRTVAGQCLAQWRVRASSAHTKGVTRAPCVPRLNHLALVAAVRTVSGVRRLFPLMFGECVPPAATNHEVDKIAPNLDHVITHIINKSIQLVGVFHFFDKLKFDTS